VLSSGIPFSLLFMPHCAGLHFSTQSLLPRSVSNRGLFLQPRFSQKKNAPPVDANLRFQGPEKLKAPGTSFNKRGSMVNSYRASGKAVGTVMERNEICYNIRA
jgi:hypothetical protein